MSRREQCRLTPAEVRGFNEIVFAETNQDIRFQVTTRLATVTSPWDEASAVYFTTFAESMWRAKALGS